MPPPPIGFVVSHTHWDRGWYLPFETFRHRMVRMVDRLLDLLEGDPDFAAFTLDGQTALLEDYAALRPEHEGRLRALVEAGRLLVGPWYVLPDLFLVSGEALVRNLQRGRRVGARFGGVMEEGYLPDPFGHVAQMPQLLRGFGLGTFIFMRGLSAEDKERLGAVFTWRAPDGSEVLAVYQREGYLAAGALGHPHVFGRFDGHTPTAELAKERLDAALATMAPLQQQRALLLSNGFDHMPEQPELPGLLRAVQADYDEREGGGPVLRHSTIPAFVAALDDEIEAAGGRQALGTYEGDLLGNADHPILSSVYSTRVYLKQQNHRAQHLLERCAEPVAAWLAQAGRGEDARAFLDHAWKLLLQNHPHDDICGCSVDAVHEDDEVRFRQSMEVAEALLTEQLETLQRRGFQAPARTAAAGAQAMDVWVYNPHPWPRRARVETSVYAPNPEGEHGPSAAAQRLAGCTAAGEAVAVTVQATEADVVRSAFLEATWARRYDVAFEIDLPPLGYHLVHLYEDGPPEDGRPADAAAAPAPPAVERDGARLAVEDGRLVYTERGAGGDAVLADALRFEYQLDDGDTYSFGPVPAHGPWWAALAEAHVDSADPAVLRLVHTLELPAAYDRAAGPEDGSDGGPVGAATLTLHTAAHLLPGGGVAFDVAYENTAENGRLRAVLPTGLAARAARADGHFRLAERAARPLVAPEEAPERYAAYPGELVYPTHHMGDFVLLEAEGDAPAPEADRRTWIAARGLHEFELLADDEREAGTCVALTLHRAVGMLSVKDGRIRRCQAGPSIPTPGAQCRRPLRAALALGTGEMPRYEAVRRARAFAHPAWARELPALPHLPAEGTQARTGRLLAIDHPAVQLSALKPADDGEGVVLRLFNLDAAPQTAVLTLGFAAARWCRTDLREGWDEAAAHSLEDGPDARLEVALGPHEIVTLRLR